jgi:outer membrane protein OmpA-like peptidoglycan-associated protein
MVLGLCGTIFGSMVYASQNLEPMAISITSATQNEDALTRYHAHKANMWLSYAKNEQSENSLTVAGQEALQHAQQLVDGFSEPQKLSLTTPILSVSQVMRRDLWAQIEYFKQHGGIDVVPQTLAEAEVMLVWAAAEYCELGWRHAKEHFFAVEQRLYQVKQQLPAVPRANVDLLALPSLVQLNGQGCRGVNTDYWPLLKPQMQVVSTVQTPENSLNVENVVHFALDKAEINAEGKSVLDNIVTLLQVESELSITLVGHTDGRASVYYNLGLSQRRINTVKDYLVGQGIEDKHITEQAKGESELISDTEQRIGHAKSRRVVIEFHDIEGKNIQVQPQWRDLQLESAKKQGKAK